MRQFWVVLPALLISIFSHSGFAEPSASPDCDAPSLIARLKALLSPKKKSPNQVVPLAPVHGDFKDLPPIGSYPLPEAYKEAIHSHPIQKLRELYGDGSEYVLALGHYTGDGSVKSGKFGESIQAEFVAKVLREVMPKLEIVTPGSREDGAKSLRGRKRIKLDIVDNSESKNLHDDRALNMPYIKAANPGLNAIPHGALRSSLGIPEENRVVSLYIRGHNQLDIRPVLTEVEKAGKPDIVFFTLGGNSNPETLYALAQKARPRYQIQLLSKFSRIEFKPEKKYLILNDVRGRLPQIYNVADVSVVMGPINLFEPLSSGSPLVYFNAPLLLQGYSLNTFLTMAQTALNTGGAVEAKHVYDLSKSITEALDRRSFLPPYMAPVQSYGKKQGLQSPSSLVLFLAHLRVKLGHELAVSANESDRIDSFGNE